MKNPFYKALGGVVLLMLAAGTLAAQTKLSMAGPMGQLAMMDLSNGEFIGGLVPVVAIIMGCSIPIVVIGLQLYFRHEKTKMLHQTIRSMVDKGIPIPPELLANADQQADCHRGPGRPDMFETVWGRRPRNDVRRGLIFIGLGIGVIIVAGKAGWIIFFLGLAFLLASFVKQTGGNDGVPPKL
jgi:hypothetical protein